MLIKISSKRTELYGFALVFALLLSAWLLSEIVPTNKVFPIKLSKKKEKIIQLWIKENGDKDECTGQSRNISREDLS